MFSQTKPIPFIALRGEHGPESILTRLHKVQLNEPISLPLAGRALADVLPRKIYDDVATTPSANSTLLLLHQTLPSAWHDAQWETLHHRNGFASAGFIVVRYASPVFSVQPEEAGRIAYLDLFPSKEFDFARALASSIESECLHRVRPRFLGRGCDDFSDLFVLAHGSPQGLLNTEGAAFSIGTAALPQRVWLLACNVDHGMYRLAEALLRRGVQTVITTTGDISAKETAAIVNLWCARAKGTSLEHWLIDYRAQTAGAAHPLTVFGRISLDQTQTVSWNADTWSNWEHPSPPPFRPIDDPSRYRHAADAIDHPATWPITCEWLLPQVLAASENYNHADLQKFNERCLDLASFSAHGAYAVANACYRLGQYDLAVRYLIRGLTNSQATEPERAELLGCLSNILIDMAIPEAAKIAIQLHQTCNIDDFKFRRDHDFRRLDYHARVALRERDYQVAIDHFAAKRQRNPEREDTRELAWLLFASALNRRSSPTETGNEGYLDEVIEILSTRPTDHIGNGNDGTAYLVRALACYHWASGNRAAKETLARWIPLIQEGLTLIDPGPWAFAACYLALADDRYSELGRRAMKSLARACYWLELAGFSSLAGMTEDQSQALRHFTRMRDRVSHELAGWNEFGHLQQTDAMDFLLPM